MKSLRLVALAAAFAFLSSASFGQTPAPAKPAATPPPAAANPQQERMKVCNEKATGMKGDERKNYMSTCLAGKEPEKPLTAQQQRMSDCSKKATGMKGDEHKKFMSECLKAKS